MVSYYCDGSSQGKKEEKKTGRFAIIKVVDDELKEEYQSEIVENATNSDMEVGALFMTLLLIFLDEEKEVTIYSDSQYAVKGYNEWMENWAKDNWTKELKQKQWKIIYKMKKIFEKRKYNVKIEWVKGHDENKWNNKVDELAQKR